MSLRRLLPVLLLALPLCGQQPGQTAERVVAKDNPQQSYALYLPSRYNPQQQWPVLFVFDPGARGKEAAEVFRAAAEKYGYIVAASNNSKNGPTRPQVEAFVAMYSDVVQRFPANPDRLYAAGFSGGARVAGLVTFFCNRCIRAVIACGAGFPGVKPEQQKQLPPYFFAVGKADFNYFEVLDAARSHSAAVALATFDGSHQWPPAEVVMAAVAWLDAGSPKADIPAPSKQEASERARQEELTRPLAGLIDTIANQSEDREQNIQDAKHDMARLRAQREKATEPEKILVYRRALGQLLVRAEQQADRLDEAKQYGLSASLLEITAEAIPPNPGLTYEIASEWAAAGEKKKALTTLKRAADLGFHDTDALARDPHFDALRDSPELKAIVATMR